MKVSVAVNNYNYSKYIIECIDSILSQTYQNIEIIVIDDGSTDDSAQLLNAKYGKNPNIKIVYKKNAGQLSTFNEVLKYIRGEIVCFMDADDIYKPTYIETVVEFYKSNLDIKFLFFAMEEYFLDGTTKILAPYSHDLDIGYSLISTLFSNEWVGNPTSAISLKTDILYEILPLPLEKDWIVCADMCLVWGASLLGVRKYYCALPLVQYRIHHSNNYYGQKFSLSYQYEREMAKNRLMKYFKNKFGIDEETVIKFVTIEFKLRNDKSHKLLMRYLRIAMESNLFFYVRIRKVIRLILIYFQERMYFG